MTLTIKIKNLEYADAADITKLVSDKVLEVEIDRAKDTMTPRPDDPELTFDYDYDDPPIPYQEDTPFSRYMNSTKKE